MPHPDQSPEAILYARENAGAHRGATRWPASAAPVAEPWTPPQPAEIVPRITKDMAMEFAKHYGFDPAALSDENAALKSEKVDLLARARIAEEAAAGAIRELHTAKDSLLQWQNAARNQKERAEGAETALLAMTERATGAEKQLVEARKEQAQAKEARTAEQAARE